MGRLQGGKALPKALGTWGLHGGMKDGLTAALLLCTCSEKAPETFFHQTSRFGVGLFACHQLLMCLFHALGESLTVLGCLHGGTRELGHKTLPPSLTPTAALRNAHRNTPGACQTSVCRQKNLPLITEILGNTLITRFFPSPMQIKKSPNHCCCSTYFFLTRLFRMGTHGISQLLPFPWKLIDLQFESCNNRFEGIPYFYTCICFALLTKRCKGVESIASSFLSWTKSSFMEPLWPSPQMFGALWLNRACGSFPGLFNLL